ncbi:Pre-mRNA splicing Prp18-interacting factor-domain-containing protein [Podospora australis]|uniref:Pre-mRNA-splicing factor SLU7 n=1 Tax=Podospora australis TaxID=1536484 RepID=A0AAN6WP00_9PEZI|nr:Pre-mRNA splicing Prp18-interacting factor-domain-containing protein [Podospora australis]
MPPPRPPSDRALTAPVSGANAQPTGSDSSRGAHAAAGAARKEDNIYIPAFISKQPFYVSGLEEVDDSLQHQRRLQQSTEDDQKAVIEKSRKLGPARTKWVKGSCENCGAMGHRKKDCLERPRKVGAKFSGKDIQADRAVRDVNLGYEAKRDVWASYDPKNYREVVEDHQMVEEARRKLIAETVKEGDKLYEQDFKYAEESELGKDGTTKKSMRLREDTAKYLLNLDSDSAKYNPKKRALVDAGAINDQSAQLFAEEAFLRGSGEAAEFEKAQRYAWEAQERAGDTSLHLQANPTAGAFLRKKEEEEREAKRRKRAEALESQYGAQPAVPEALKAAAITESERFVEYDEAGLVKGAPRQVARSKYPEDIRINNHTSTWGSWWSDFQWGYKCCHSLMKNSWCTGESAREKTPPSSLLHWDIR